jgi:REP element-mobilizing transposase RayT
MVRGIEGRSIFRDDHDRDDFLRRLAEVAVAKDLTIYAWALLPNHLHLLLRTRIPPLARAMRSLLTGYAGAFNRRHRRRGREEYVGDEPVLGSSEFVASLQQELARQQAESPSAIPLDTIIQSVCAAVGVPAETLRQGCRLRQVCRAREGVAYLALVLCGSPTRCAFRQGGDAYV